VWVKAQKEVSQEGEEEMPGTGFDFVLNLLYNRFLPKGLSFSRQRCQLPTQ
jgi:hypothetical protein